MSRIAVLSVAIVSLLIGAGARADQKAEAAPLSGVWLPEAADAQNATYLDRIWWSKFTIQGDKFAVSKVMTHPKDLTGTFTLDPTTSPKSIDFKVNELDFAELEMPMKIPAVTLPGIYKVEGDRLVLCFHLDPDLKRPTEFAASGKKTVVLKLGRAAATFKELPTEVTVTVKGLDGKPVAGATAFAFMYQTEPRDPKAGGRKWQYSHATETGPDGTARIKYDEVAQGVRARVEAKHLIGFTSTSPFALQSAALTVQLEPEVRLTGAIESADLKKAGQPLGWTNTYLYHRGSRIGMFSSPDGKFEYPVPAGDYALNAYGSDVRDTTVPVSVPGGRSEFAMPPINLAASALAVLKGKPAPELAGIVGWKGAPVTLADLKGKIVLLEYWGYWCGPCVHSMPTLFELHDRFKDKGLAVIGVHLDMDGEVDTAAKLDEKLVDIRKKLWKDRDLPFPVVLASGKRVEDGKGLALRGGPAAQYGIMGYPTTVLIGRDGKVVGQFHARDAAAAVKEMEKLLTEKK